MMHIVALATLIFVVAAHGLFLHLIAIMNRMTHTYDQRYPVGSRFGLGSWPMSKPDTGWSSRPNSTNGRLRHFFKRSAP
jgi:hypothetical protein